MSRQQSSFNALNLSLQCTTSPAGCRRFHPRKPMSSVTCLQAMSRRPRNLLTAASLRSTAHRQSRLPMDSRANASVVAGSGGAEATRVQTMPSRQATACRRRAIVRRPTRHHRKQGNIINQMARRRLSMAKPSLHASVGVGAAVGAKVERQHQQHQHHPQVRIQATMHHRHLQVRPQPVRRLHPMMRLRLSS